MLQDSQLPQEPLPATSSSSDWHLPPVPQLGPRLELVSSPQAQLPPVPKLLPARAHEAKERLEPAAPEEMNLQQPLNPDLSLPPLPQLQSGLGLAELTVSMQN